MILLQVTESVTGQVIASAAREERPFILLFMIAVIIALWGALYLLYRDEKKEREANNEAREKSESRQIMALNGLTHAISELSSTCRDISKDLGDVKVSVNNLNNYVREK